MENEDFMKKILIPIALNVDTTTCHFFIALVSFESIGIRVKGIKALKNDHIKSLTDILNILKSHFLKTSTDNKSLEKIYPSEGSDINMKKFISVASSLFRKKIVSSESTDLDYL